MAGVGVRLKKIFGNNTITTNLIGFGYSMMISIAPMIVVIVAVIIMQQILGYSKETYANRELYTSTVLYIFIFALISAAPFNAVLSRFLSDVIFNETYDDIMACYYVGLFLNIALAALMGIPFCWHEHFVGGVPVYYVFTGYCGYMSLVFVFYSQLYLYITKDYKKISFDFCFGMVITVILSWIFVNVFQMAIGYSMLLALSIGFLIAGCFAYAVIKSYFRVNSGRYMYVLSYFKKYWQLVVINSFYILGLYVHNFVFWTSGLQLIVVKSFVCAPSYDLATCAAMFTNLSATMIFTSRVEMYFRDRYKLFSESIIGGRLMDIEEAKKRMFSQLSEEIMSLVRLQFIISVFVFLIASVMMPRLGFGGLTYRIYPCLAAAYFIMFIMYSAIIFMYYLNDLTGAMTTALVFFGVTLIVSIFAKSFLDIWYGAGLLAGAFASWCVAYARLRYMEGYIDIHIFCQGNILQKGTGRMPSNRIYAK